MTIWLVVINKAPAAFGCNSSPRVINNRLSVQVGRMPVPARRSNSRKPTAARQASPSAIATRTRSTLGLNAAIEKPTANTLAVRPRRYALLARSNSPSAISNCSWYCCQIRNGNAESAATIVWISSPPKILWPTVVKNAATNIQQVAVASTVAKIRVPNSVPIRKRNLPCAARFATAWPRLSPASVAKSSVHEVAAAMVPRPEGPKTLAVTATMQSCARTVYPRTPTVSAVLRQKSGI